MNRNETHLLIRRKFLCVLRILFVKTVEVYW